MSNRWWRGGDPVRWVLTAVAAGLYGLGWVAGVVVTGVGWTAAAVRVGWAEARRKGR